MGVRDFLVKIPELCHAANKERWAHLIAYQFDHELAHDNSVFARNAIDEMHPENRFETAFAFNGDPGRKAHCKMLAEILLLAHYKHEHGEDKWDGRLNELAFMAGETERQYPDIAAVMSVENAVSAGGWNS